MTADEGNSLGAGTGNLDRSDDPPLAPLPRPQDHGDVPIKSGARRALGIKVPGTGAPFYFLANARGLGSRYRRRFPLTADGWTAAWREFASEDPEAAQEYKQDLVDRGTQAWRKAQLSEAYARLSRLPQLAVVPDCTLIGGYGYDPLAVSRRYDVYFTDQEVLITPAAVPEPEARLEYVHVLALRVDGPGAVTTGGGFIGGGFGAVGAAEGMIVASALNALTTRTTIQTIIEVQDRTRDFVFFQSRETPEHLRLRLLSVEAKLRQAAAQRETTARDAASDPLHRLERLRLLHKDGALTDEEFDAAKRQILADL